MAKDRETAYNGIVEHISGQGGLYSDWYCGITSDIDKRLHEEHNLPREKDTFWSIWYKCFNDDDARAVETALLRKGCDGGKGGGDESSVYVYAYLKQDGTNP